MSIKLTSTAFQDGGLIPSNYTCDGANVSPTLNWSGVPPTAKALAIVCEDPDAPGKTWVHWVVYDIPPTTMQLPEGIVHEEKLSNGSKQGTNDFKNVGYGGPCPPSGTHRYFFRLYALDSETSLGLGATKERLLEAIDGHVLAQGELMGKYKR